MLPSIPNMKDADLKGKIVLVRVDHNVVKKGKIIDPYRIDATIPTLFNIVAQGGKFILMTHIGRPKDKKAGTIEINPTNDVPPIVEYLEHKLQIKIKVPTCAAKDNTGYPNLGGNLRDLVQELKQGKFEAIYLPNTRFFSGEEDKGELAEALGKELSSYADVFVNDAFGSWQPHASTVKPTKYLPSFAGLLMQKEIENLLTLFNPKRPLIGIVAGSKFDTKIGPMKQLLQTVDYLVMGGVIYNAYLAVKYDLQIAGLGEDDLAIAKEFVEMTAKYPGKVIELPYIVESDTLDGKIENQYRTHYLKDLKPGTKLNYILDADPKSFELPEVIEIFGKAETFFINAVMGFTPHFGEGTAAMYKLIDTNKKAMKMFGGGDTLQEFKTMLPGIYMNALDNPTYYFFTGGGTILTAIEKGSATDLPTIEALIANKGMKP